MLSATARVFGRVPWFRAWLERHETSILSVEQQLLQFHTRAPKAFWGSTLLNLLSHGLAIGEVYLILLLMGSKVSFLGALMLEALTKLINAAGGVIPGGVGAYEGGNMAIVKLVGLTGAEGLTLGLCRRFRSIVWAIIGGVCLLYFSRSRQSSHPRESRNSETESNMMLAQEPKQNDAQSPSLLKVAVVLANETPATTNFSHSLFAKVGALPLVLRAILSAKSAGADRIMVVVDPIDGPAIRGALAQNKRLPRDIVWLETLPESAISVAVQLAASGGERVILIQGDRSYHPSLYRTASEWDGDGALEFTSAGKSIGLTVLSHDLALELARHPGLEIRNFEDLHNSICSRHGANTGPTTKYEQSVSDDKWQAVASEQDRLAAEAKLDRWLVKPTDGFFAQMNRRVSIPISRQLIKFPITANMVTIFTFGVSLAAGLFYAFGGYWSVLIGAVLSVWASILDGCDGEVARLKLQATAFGCWLETICDYLYYLFIFGGMTIGLTRSWHARRFLYWGAALFVGAVATFIIAGLSRQRLSGKHPEQYLAVWQKKAESRLSNPLMYVGRYCEFMIRRCCLPYILLVLAVLDFTPATLYGSAIGANIAWIIALYSYLAFTRKQRLATMTLVPSAPATKPVTA